ncbi:RsfA family transcriptional regulator [Virgibacillus sp. SK37]|uniref:RsfA family transcriptional regulator n=1 Tax=Virgibacillus sp. SK37 TaxID=403957 RepID=UPI0004D1235F|nr:RsfA family transcriptional regulator [Virgibacillus sp. SK37]AIF43336.1 transcriptional regulator [Virgibacillus sp. SK37]
MVKVRQDAWSHEDDLLLAETVLRHIREGSTQLNAFEEVGDKLNRTSAACGFRWNAEVRSKYENAIDLAKRQRKEKKRAVAAAGQKLNKPVIELSQTAEAHIDSNSEYSEATASTLTIDSVIRFLKDLKKDYYASNQSKNTLEQYKKDNLKLHDQVNQLEKQLAQTEAQLSTIQEDYQVFIQIMDRARKMTVLDDQGTMPSPAFRMDKNGNLQQLAQGN